MFLLWTKYHDRSTLSQLKSYYFDYVYSEFVACLSSFISMFVKLCNNFSFIYRHSPLIFSSSSISSLLLALHYSITSPLTSLVVLSILSFCCTAVELFVSDTLSLLSLSKGFSCLPCKPQASTLTLLLLIARVFLTLNGTYPSSVFSNTAVLFPFLYSLILFHFFFSFRWPLSSPWLSIPYMNFTCYCHYVYVCCLFCPSCLQIFFFQINRWQFLASVHRTHFSTLV